MRLIRNNRGEHSCGTLAIARILMLLLRTCVTIAAFLGGAAHAATISDVSSSTSNGSYKAGDQISIQVSFSAPVTVTGTPKLTLETGVTDAVISYSSGSGTAVLTFLYTIAAGHNSSDLDYQSQSALSLNGGTIKNKATNQNASLTLPTPGSTGSLAANKSIVVDTSAPTVSLALVSTSPTNSLPISIQVTFNESVTGFTSSDLTVTNGAVSGFLGSGTTYTATITASAQGNVSIQVPSNAAFDAVGNGNSASNSLTAVYDIQPPFVTNVTSSPVSGAYRATQSVNVIVAFSETVVVAGPAPTISLASNSPAPSATYVSGSGTNQLTFRYTINTGDYSEDLDYSSTNALLLNGGTIRDNAGNTGILTLPNPGGTGSLSVNSNVIIDTSLPSVTITSSISGDTALDIIPVTVVFSEPVSGFALNDFSVSNGCASNLQGSGTTYTADIVPRANGPVLVTVPASVAIDRAGNGNTAAPTPVSVNFSTFAPLVTSVNSTTSDGAYRAGQTISLQVSFSEAVIVNGTPQLRLATGSIATVDYLSGSGTDTLTFQYTIASGHNSNDLDYIPLPPLILNGGQIVDAATQSLDIARTFACPGAAGSLSFNKNIIVDTIVPTIARVTSTTPNGSYRTGQTLNVQAQFTETVYVTGTPLLTLETGANDAVVSMVSGSGSANLNFNYTIIDGHNSSRLDYQSINAFSVNGSVIQDLAGNTAIVTLPSTGSTNSLFGQKLLVVDTTPPTVPNVTSTTANGSYKAGTAINVRIALSEAVYVTGSPRIQLATGMPNRFATYSSGSGSANLDFTYTVSSGDTANDLDYTSTSAFDLNGGSVRDAAGNDSITSLAAPGTQFSLSSNKDIRLDTTAPTVTAVGSTLANGSYSTGTVVPIRLTFSEAVNVSGNPTILLNTGADQGVAHYTSGSGSSVLTFTYTVQAGHSSSDLDYTSTTALTIPSGSSIRDAASNDLIATLPAPGAAGSISASSNIIIDTQEPVVTQVTSNTPDGAYRAGTSLTILVTFSEPIYLSGSLQLALASGSSPNTATCTSIVSANTLVCSYTVQAGDSSTDLDYLDVSSLALLSPGTTLLDAAGNIANLTLAAPSSPASLSAAKNIILDTTSPTAVLSSAAPQDTNTSPIPITITFSEPVTGLTVAAFSLTNATIQNLSGTGAAYTAELVPAAEGTLSATLNAAAVLDVAGNSNPASNTLSRNYDSVRPTVSLASSLSERSNASFIPVTITFSESVSGFDSSDISITNGAVTSISGSGSTYTVDIAPTTDGDVSISIAQNVAFDVAQNGNQASSTLSRIIDRSIPTISSVTTSLADAAYPAGSLITIDIVFSEPVQLSGSFSLALATNNANSLALCDQITNPNTLRCTYTVVAGDNTDDLDYVAQDSLTALAGASLTDLAENPAAISLPIPGANGSLSATHTIILDTNAPSVVLSSAAPQDTSTSPIPVTITFSEPVTGLTLAAFSLTNATIQNLAGTGAAYTAELVPAAEGTLSATLNAAAVLDIAGNSNPASNTFTRNYDSVRPTISLASSLPERSSASSIPLTIIFSESVSGFDSTDISVTNGAVTSISGSGSTYTATVEPTADGDVSISIAQNIAFDVALNGNQASLTLSRTIDRSTPTISSVTTFLADAAYPATSLITIDVIFSEPVQLSGNLSLALAANNGNSLAVCNQITNPNTLRCTYTVAAGDHTDDLDYVAVDALVAIDGATLSDFAENPALLSLPTPGTSGSLSAAHAIILDTTAPSALLSSAAPQDANTSPIPITITFSEPVTGLTLTAFSITNATVQNLAGTGAVYTAELVPGAQGPVSVTLNAAAGLDAAGNSNPASNTLSRNYDSVRPTVSLESSLPERSNASSIPLTITFSESVTGFDSSDISVTNGTVTSISGAGTTYAATVIPTADGDVSISIAQNVAFDVAQNGNHASLALSRTIDRSTPTVTSVTTSPADAAYPAGSIITIDLIFSEPVQLSGSFSLALATNNGNSVALCDQITNPNTLRCTYTVTAGDNTDDLDYTAEDALVGFAGAALTDLAENPASLALPTPSTNGSLSANHTVILDTVRPTATLSSTASNPTNISPLTISVTFSEAVTGISPSSFSVSNAAVVSVSGSGNTYSVLVSPQSQGSISISILEGGVVDRAQNGCIASSELTRIFDSVRPEVSLGQTSSQIIPTNSLTIPIEFTEAVSGFEASDFTVTNGSVQSLSGSGTSYSAQILSDHDGELKVSISENAAVDSAGNGSVASGELNRLVDTTSPHIVSVTSTNPNGHYKAGSVLMLQVQLSEVTTLSGTPKLLLQTGRAGAYATYKSGSDSETLVFEYVIMDGDNTQDLDCASVVALVLEQSTITDRALHSLDTTLPALGSTQSLAALKDIIIDTVPPTVPVILSPQAGQTLASRSVTISGTTEAGGSLDIVNANDTTLCSTTADDSGSWSCKISELKDGFYAVRARAEDLAGNSSTSTENTFTINTTLPSPPVFTEPVNGLTTETKPRFAGTATASMLVHVQLDGNELCTATVDSTGSWACTSEASLQAGRYTIKGITEDPDDSAQSLPTSLALTVGSRFSGVVLMANRTQDPLAGVSISDGAATTQTDSDGTYSLVTVDPESPSITATKKGWRISRATTPEVAATSTGAGVAWHAVPALESETYTVWNGALLPFQPALRILNRSGSSQPVSVTLYQANGTECTEKINATTNPMDYVTIPLDRSTCFSTDSFGLVTINYPSNEYDGELTMQRGQAADSYLTSVFSLPLSNSITGTSHVFVDNAYHIERGGEQAYVMRNELIISNLASSEKRFTVRRFRSNTALTKSETVVIPARGSARVEFPLEEEEGQENGIQEIEPEDRAAPYSAVLARSGEQQLRPPHKTGKFLFMDYARAGGSKNHFARVRYLPKRVAVQYVEIANVSTQGANVQVARVNRRGKIRPSISIYLKPKETRKLRLSRLLERYQEGMAHISSDMPDSIIVNSIIKHYRRDKKLLSIKALSIRETFGDTIYSIYQRLGRTRTLLKLTNVDGQEVQGSVMCYHDSQLQDAQQYTLKPGGQTELLLEKCFNRALGGVVEVNASRPGAVVADTIRFRKSEEINLPGRLR